MVDLSAKPFGLDKASIQWVEATLKSMTEEEKLGQLFCPIGYSTDRGYLDYELLGKHIGGLFFRDGVSREMWDTFRYAQENSRIPLLIPSNLEAGGQGAATDGTYVGSQMAIAATGRTENAYRLGLVCGREGAALGINWSFAPVVDLDRNFRNPITNVRTYGQDPDQVVSYASAYMRGVRECGVAPCIKHFPGDGMDERDQHLLTSVNPLSTAAWDATYGAVYQRLIREGAMSVMVGHIALPEYAKRLGAEGKEAYLPATLSPVLISGLLRDKLGFQGLVTTDATPMVGFTSAMAREQAIPLAIERGCDMILFNKDLSEDLQFMRRGLEKGLLSEARLHEALTRILGMKAALGLHKRQKERALTKPEQGLSVIHAAEHVGWSREIAEEAITLVKDTGNNLPLSAKRTRRVLLEILGSFPSNARVLRKFQSELSRRGFAVTVYERENFELGVDTVTTFHEKYDLVLYIGNVENASNQTTNRIHWYTFWGQGNNVPWFAHEVPTVFVSMANPYHLLDVPMVGTYVNCYSNADVYIEAAVEKLTGESAFLGKSPTDPFCGRKELAY